jgi:formiminotetrahydrofolate cyclodeaminase
MLMRQSNAINKSLSNVLINIGLVLGQRMNYAVKSQIHEFNKNDEHR